MGGPEERGSGKPDVEGLMQTKVSSLGQLKSVMTKNLGEEEPGPLRRHPTEGNSARSSPIWLGGGEIRGAARAVDS